MDGQVWDVKPDNARQRKAGKKQVEKYVANTWAKHPDISLKVGGDEIKRDSFYYKSGLTTYKVTYRYAGDGVIAYHYDVYDYDYETLANTIVVIGAAVVLGYASSVPGWLLGLLGLA